LVSRFLKTELIDSEKESDEKKTNFQQNSDFNAYRSKP
jgi:hypothetical protein